MRLGIIGSLGWRLRLAGRDTLSSLGFAKLCACVCVGKGCARLFSVSGYVATRSSWRHLDRLAAQTQASALPSPDRERGVSYPRKVFPPACSLALLRNCLWRQPLPSSRSRPAPGHSVAGNTARCPPQAPRPLTLQRAGLHRSPDALSQGSSRSGRCTQADSTTTWP